MTGFKLTKQKYAYLVMSYAVLAPSNDIQANEVLTGGAEVDCAREALSVLTKPVGEVGEVGSEEKKPGVVDTFIADLTQEIERRERRALRAVMVAPPITTLATAIMFLMMPPVVRAVPPVAIGVGVAEGAGCLEGVGTMIGVSAEVVGGAVIGGVMAGTVIVTGGIATVAYIVKTRGGFP